MWEKTRRIKSDVVVGKGKISPNQVASIVDRYLADNNFSTTRSSFRAEVSSITPDAPVQEVPNSERLLNLKELLDEYIWMKSVIPNCVPIDLDIGYPALKAVPSVITPKPPRKRKSCKAIPDDPKPIKKKMYELTVEKPFMFSAKGKTVAKYSWDAPFEYPESNASNWKPSQTSASYYSDKSITSEDEISSRFRTNFTTPTASHLVPSCSECVKELYRLSLTGIIESGTPVFIFGLSFFKQDDANRITFMAIMEDADKKSYLEMKYEMSLQEKLS